MTRFADEVPDAGALRRSQMLARALIGVLVVGGIMVVAGASVWLVGVRRGRLRRSTAP